MRSSLSPSRRSLLSRLDIPPRGPASTPRPAPRRFDGFRVLLGTLLGLVLSALLASASLVDIAERLPFGPDRDRWLYAAQTVDGASHNLLLDRPGDWIRQALGYDDGPEGVIIGELALGDEPAFIRESSSASPSIDGGGDAEAIQQPEPPLPAVPEGLPREPQLADGPASPLETTAAIPQLREIEPDAPLRMWLGGDSLGQYVANHLSYRIAPRETTEITTDYHISTGLTRPDYFDWPAHFTDVATGEDRPEALVYMVGGNDDQPMRLQSVRLEPLTPEWREEYGRRVGLLMDVVAYADTRLIWVSLPPMESERRSLIADEVNTILTAQAARRPWVVVVPIEDLFVDDHGDYAQFVDAPDGGQALARQSDGVHLSDEGSRWVADRVWREITRLWPTVDGAAMSGDAAATGS